MEFAEIESALKRYFSHDTFRKPQDEIISSIVSGKDTLAIMPTGGGKSLCYQLPAMLLDGITLVISPLIALMKDQVDALIAKGIPAGMINSSQTWEQQLDVLNRLQNGELKLASSEGFVHICYFTTDAVQFTVPLCFPEEILKPAQDFQQKKPQLILPGHRIRQGVGKPGGSRGVPQILGSGTET